MMNLFANYIPLVLAIAFGRLSDSVAIPDRSQHINCPYSTNDIPTTKSDPSHDRCCCTSSGECKTYHSRTHKCNHDTGEIRPIHHQDSVAITDRSQYINCSYSTYDIPTTKSDPSHDKCCCRSPKECKTYRSSTHNCNHDTGEIQPIHRHEYTATNSDLTINCSYPTNDIPTTKSDPSHDKCCCRSQEDCKTYRSSTHNCNPNTGEIRPHPPTEKKVTTDNDLNINCSFPTDDIHTRKKNSLHDKCCCTSSGKCTTYLSTTHYCDSETDEIRTLARREPLDTNCLRLPFGKNRRSGYLCCRNDTAYLPDVMSCDSSSGEVTLKSNAKFESVKLCRKKLPRALDRASAPQVRNKEIHIEGRVEKVRVDIGANYLIIDLLPFRFNSATKNSACSREDRGRLQVRVMLPPKRWCQPLDEIQEYLYDKTLDIWTDFQSLGHCRPKRRGFQIPYESENHWMMVSQRVFYFKR